MRKRIYALYKGDTFIDLGTIEYLAKVLNVSKRTIHFYSTPSYRKRSENGYIVIRIEDEE